MTITVPGARKPSAECEAHIKGFEKLKLASYMPTKDDVPTIGWGSTGPDIRMGMIWTKGEADARFARDLAKFAAAVDRLIGDAATEQHEFDAMVGLAYNIGIGSPKMALPGGFTRSTVLRRHKQGDRMRAERAFHLWNKQKGKVLKGLVRRRAVEAAMYRGGAA